jgi:hypothetical protein
LLVDALPGLVLLLFLIWREATRQLAARQQQRVARLFLLLGFVAIVIQAAGLYRPATQRWNEVAIAQPTAVSGPLGDFFDPRYAQFVAGNDTVCDLQRRNVQGVLAAHDLLRPLAAGEPVPWDADATAGLTLEGALLGADLPLRTPQPAAYSGWQPVGAVTGDGRWNDCPQATLWFEPGLDFPTTGMIWLTLNGTPLFDDQPLVASLNGGAPLEMSWPAGQETVAVPLPAAALRLEELNEIVLDFPEARPFPPRLDFYRLRLDDATHAVRLRTWQLAEVVPGW